MVIKQKKKVTPWTRISSISKVELENFNSATENAIRTITKTTKKLIGLDLLKMLVIMLSFCIFAS